MKYNKTQGDERRCLRGVSPAHAGTDATFCQGQMLLRKERRSAVKISCEFKKQANQIQIVELHSM
jgi:hypothetical protein